MVQGTHGGPDSGQQNTWSCSPPSLTWGLPARGWGAAKALDYWPQDPLHRVSKVGRPAWGGKALLWELLDTQLNWPSRREWVPSILPPPGRATQPKASRMAQVVAVLALEATLGEQTASATSLLCPQSLGWAQSWRQSDQSLSPNLTHTWLDKSHTR